jgi:CO/xanthine dehydrogenase FAD-binding subunit
MLINLETVKKAANLSEAGQALRRGGVYPLYGEGAALLRLNSRDIHEVVDLSGVVPGGCEVAGDAARLGAGAKLADVVKFDARIGGVIKAVWPITLQNALTVGDVLMEADSPLLALLHGMGARIDTPGRGEDDLIEIARWCQMPMAERRTTILQAVVIPQYVGSRWHFAVEKVSRTPADAPIVAAIGFAHAGDPDPGAFAVVHGLAAYPVRYVHGLTSKLDDYKGSADYRAAMARVLSEAAIARAQQMTL